MSIRRYQVELTRQAEKDLKRLKPWTEQATRALLQLEADPTIGHILAGSLRGTRSLEFSLRGSGVYRAVYIILDDTACIVFIGGPGPHENIYKRAEQRYEALKRTGKF